MGFSVIKLGRVAEVLLRREREEEEENRRGEEKMEVEEQGRRRKEVGFIEEWWILDNALYTFWRLNCRLINVVSRRDNLGRFRVRSTSDHN